MSLFIRYRHPFSLLLLGCALLCTSSLALAADDGFSVHDVRTRLAADGTYRLNAQIDYRFSDEPLKALQNGVPLDLEVHIQVRRANAWLWEDSLLDSQRRFRIRYKPLSERYEVFRLPDTHGHSFVTREAALRTLGEISDLELIPASKLDPDERYEVQIRAALDIEELPLPLRPLAYLSPSWKLSTGWTKWPLNP